MARPAASSSRATDRAVAAAAACNSAAVVSPSASAFAANLLTATPMRTAAVRACINSVSASRTGAPGSSAPDAAAIAEVPTYAVGLRSARAAAPQMTWYSPTVKRAFTATDRPGKR